MRKIYISVLGIYFSILSAFGQIIEKDTSTYKKRKLKLEEVTILTSYYNQNGTHSAVTGGIGTEKLVDNSNLFEVKFVKGKSFQTSRILSIQLGIDAYSSASSDNIDPATISGASKSDRRIYPTVTWTQNYDSTRKSIGIIGYASKEFDYTSLSPGLLFLRSSRNLNQSVSLRLQAFFDNWKIILPIELRHNPEDQITTTKRNTYNANFIFTNVMNKRMQAALLVDLSYQAGLLSTPFHRVYFNNGDLRVEKLPDTRFKLPIGARFNYFIGDRVVLRSFYRFYYDTWNLVSNTMSLEASIKITPFLSVGPVYRFAAQNAVNYFAPFAQHSPTDKYYTSDYDLSKFTSNLFGINFRKVSVDGILGIKKLNSIELRYSYYTRSNNLHANSIALYMKFK